MSDAVNIPTYFVPKYVEWIEYIADKLFISSFFLNKLKDLPFNYLSPIFTNLALLCLATAYTLQLFSSPFYQTGMPDAWNYNERAFGFNFIGSLTAWTCIIFPEIWLVCTWIFCVNNLIWLLNEHTKKIAPSVYPMMAKNQDAYCNYVLSITLATFISAISHTFNQAGIGRLVNWLATGIGLYFLWQSGQETMPQILDQSQIKVA
jgi:hypothetical protein